MIIDFHTHTFPDAISVSALKTLSANSGIKPRYDGSAAGLSEVLHHACVDYGVVLSIATNERQQRKVNDFAASLNRFNNLIGFGSVYPKAPDVLEELNRIKALGLKGVKLHPDYQQFFVDDLEYMYPIYRRIAQLGLITVFHAGRDIGIPGDIHCTPAALARILPLFDGAPVIAAHFGGYLCWDEVERHLVGSDCYLDTAYCYGRMPLPQAKRIVERHGAYRVLFGSDLPWSRPEDELFFVKSLGLTESDEAAILGGNARRLLAL